MLLGTVFSALSNVFGMTLRQRESIIGLSIFLLLPLTFLSTAFMAKTLMPGWMQAVAAANPVNWALEAGAGALGAVGRLGSSLLARRLAARPRGADRWLSTRTFRAYQKTV